MSRLREPRRTGGREVAEAKGFLIAGEWRTTSDAFEVKSPYDDEVVATVASPSKSDVEDAVSAAAAVFAESRTLPVHVRAEALAHISRRLQERADEVAQTIAREGGKPIKWAKVEAARAVSTFRWAWPSRSSRTSGTRSHRRRDPGSRRSDL